MLHVRRLPAASSSTSLFAVGVTGRPAPGAARRPSGAEDGRRAAIKASRAHSTPVSDIYPPAPDVNVRQLLCELPAENYYRGQLSTSVTVRVTVRETV